MSQVKANEKAGFEYFLGRCYPVVVEIVEMLFKQNMTLYSKGKNNSHVKDINHARRKQTAMQ